MAKLIKVTGEVTQVEPTAKDGMFTLEELQGFVEGYIEVVRLSNTTLGAGSLLMIVNEEGRIKGLEVNAKASQLAGQLIVGNVLVCNSSQID